MHATDVVHRQYQHAPHAGAFMARALWRGKHRNPHPHALTLQWSGARWAEAQYALVQTLTGLRSGSALQLLLPQVLGFRLVMATLTDTEFALPIWSALQVRNRLRLLADYDPLRRLDLQASTGAWRQLSKGQEVDVLLRVSQGGRDVWQGQTSFYYRGRSVPGEKVFEPPAAPDVGEASLAQWSAPSGGGWSFGSLTGDYNGLHWSARYARAMGFRQAFHHPANALGQCMAHLQGVRESTASVCAQALDVWVKGPVPYATPLTLCGRGSAQSEQGVAFALHHDGDPRAALVARWWTPSQPSPL